MLLGYRGTGATGNYQLKLVAIIIMATFPWLLAARVAGSAAEQYLWRLAPNTWENNDPNLNK